MADVRLIEPRALTLTFEPAPMMLFRFDWEPYEDWRPEAWEFTDLRGEAGTLGFRFERAAGGSGRGREVVGCWEEDEGP